MQIKKWNVKRITNKTEWNGIFAQQTEKIINLTHHCDYYPNESITRQFITETNRISPKIRHRISSSLAKKWTGKKPVTSQSYKHPLTDYLKIEEKELTFLKYK